MAIGYFSQLLFEKKSGRQFLSRPNAIPDVFPNVLCRPAGLMESNGICICISIHILEFFIYSRNRFGRRAPFQG